MYGSSLNILNRIQRNITVKYCEIIWYVLTSNIYKPGNFREIHKHTILVCYKLWMVIWKLGDRIWMDIGSICVVYYCHCLLRAMINLLEINTLFYPIMHYIMIFYVTCRKNHAYRRFSSTLAWFPPSLYSGKAMSTCFEGVHILVKIQLFYIWNSFSFSAFAGFCWITGKSHHNKFILSHFFPLCEQISVFVGKLIHLFFSLSIILFFFRYSRCLQPPTSTLVFYCLKFVKIKGLL